MKRLSRLSKKILYTTDHPPFSYRPLLFVHSSNYPCSTQTINLRSPRTVVCAVIKAVYVIHTLIIFTVFVSSDLSFDQDVFLSPVFT